MSKKRLFDAEHLAAKCRAEGLEVLSVSEPSDVEDGEVKLTETIHIQVLGNELGAFAAGLVKELPDGKFEFSDPLEDLDEVVRLAGDMVRGKTPDTRPLWKREFPDFDMDIDIPDYWQDTSWHNDACPSFSPVPGLRVFTDHYEPGKRESESGARFWIMQERAEEDDEVAMITDDWDDVLLFVKGYESRPVPDTLAQAKRLAEWAMEEANKAFGYEYDPYADFLTWLSAETALRASIIRRRDANARARFEAQREITGTRIPEYDGTGSGVRAWFDEMARAGLIFHPDDDPSDIVGLNFTDEECEKLRAIIEWIDRCYPTRLHADALAALNDPENYK